MKDWHRGVLKDRLFDLPRGTTVILAESCLRHRSISKTYWIISPEMKKAYHVADLVAGTDCKYLVRVERPAKDQQLCAELAMKLCKEGQYGPKHRPEIQDLLARR